MKEENHRLDDYFKCYGKITFRNIRLFVDYHTAEDICQETFLRLSENLDHVPPKMVKAWLLVVSERLAKDALKKGGQYKTRVGLTLEEIDIPDLCADVEGIVEEREESQRKMAVFECLKQKNPKWHDALLMKYDKKLSDQEISRELGIKESLVGQWRRRARLWMKDEYARKYGKRDR